MTVDSIRERSKRTLDRARSNYETSRSLPNTVWYGRVLAFRYGIDDAIAVFSEGLQRHPDSFELLRQRGHRFLSARRFVEGRADLARAAELIEGLPEWIEPDGEGNELLLSDVLSSDQAQVGAKLEQDDECTMLHQAVALLDERERRIMEMRFGLKDGVEHTQKEVADAIGISQSYISRLEKRIIRRLRQQLEQMV